jgi:acetylglutamate kinase
MKINGSMQIVKRIASYQRRYRDKTFVVKIGGAVLANAKALDGVAEQCQVLADLGFRLVLVHGGGPQISAWSRRLGVEPVIINGRRVTDDVALETLKMVLAGQLNADLVSALRRAGMLPVGLTGMDGGTVLALRRPPVNVTAEDGQERLVDFGHVGDIQEVNGSLLETLLAEGYMPVIGCLAADDKGNPLNVNADIFAESIAVALQAKKLIFLTDQPGILRDPKDSTSLVPFADAGDVQALEAEGVLTGGMRLKANACVRASTGGVKRTHIIDGGLPDSLLIELFTGEGCGTMIVNEKEKQVYQETELV